MKSTNARILFVLIAILVLLFADNLMAQIQSSPKTKKILVVYYSWSGNTREVAAQIKAGTGGDLFEIIPEAAYPADYDEVLDQAKKEIATDYRPKLKSKPDNIASHDVIFVGSPNWWSTIAPPVATVLTSYDFSGKMIVPFITHEGSRMGHSVSDIKKLCPNATVLNGISIRGSSVKEAQETVLKWLNEIEVAQ